MSNSQNPTVASKEYNPSFFSQDTLVGTDANSLHPLIRGTDDTTAGGAPLRGTQLQPIPSDNFHFVSTRVVKEIPKSATKAPANPNSRLGRLKNMLKPPVVKAVEALPSSEGKTYRVDEQGRIIETTVRRAAVAGNIYSEGSG